MPRYLAPLAMLAVFAHALPTYAAGGHYEVQDAALAEPGRCQLEAWYARADSDNDAFTILPACNPWGSVEIGLGLTHERLADDSDTIAEFELKTVFRELTPGSYGWGLSLASTYSDRTGRFEGAVLVAPLSVAVADNLTMHYNLGWAHVRGGEDASVWGVGGDVVLSPSFNLIAEVYGGGGDFETELQLGLRYAVGVGAVDVSYGRLWDDSDVDWATLGFAWAF